LYSEKGHNSGAFLLIVSLLQPIMNYCHNIRKGVTNRPFSKTITDDLAFSIQYCLEAGIQNGILKGKIADLDVIYSGIVFAFFNDT